MYTFFFNIIISIIIQQRVSHAIDSKLQYNAYQDTFLRRTEPYLEITGDGTAIFDSQLRLFAKIHTNNRSYDVIHQYEWTNDVTFLHITSKADWTYGKTVGYLYKVFPDAFYLTEGDYNMNVKIHDVEYDGRNGVIFEADHTFKLTTKLNTELMFYQDSAVVMPRHVFSTNKLLNLHIILLDRFVFKPIVQYTCNMNGTFLISSPLSRFNVNINSTGEASFYIEISLLVNSTISDFPIKKNGVAKQTIIFKDGINDVNVTALNHMVQGEQFNASMSCLGSPPLTISAQLFYPNGTVYEESWRNDSISDCFLLIQNITMDTIGEYKLKIEVINDVSKESIHQSILVVERIPSPLVAIICIVMVVLITCSMIISTFIGRSRRKTDGETADFNFHSSLANPETVREKNNSFVFRTLQFFATHLQDIVNVIQQNAPQPYDRDGDTAPIITEDELDQDLSHIFHTGVDGSKSKVPDQGLNVL